jgi:uncharacterized protein
VLSKLDRLKDILRSGRRTLVAYSGGVDSVFLAKAAHQTLGADMLAVIADSPSLPRREFAAALELAKRFEFPVRVIKTDEMANTDYTDNPSNRCYFCKTELFAKLAKLAGAEGWQTIAYGENADDAGDFRPGAQAAAEHRVRAPLKEAGLTKAEIRELSAQWGLPTADKPAMACLSSRLPYGEPVSMEALAMIEAAENVVRDAGFRDVRVRHHRNLARIEVGPGELGRLMEQGMREFLSQSLKKIGYVYVAVDIEGYRQGSGNEVLRRPEPSGANSE